VKSFRKTLNREGPMFHRLKATAAALALMAGTALAAQDTLTIGMQLEPPNLDPTTGAASAIREVTYANLYEGLTRFAPDGSVVPGLAQSWSAEEGGRIWVFNLREGVTFHDGTGFDAADVVFTLDRARAADSTNAQKQLFAGIETVEAVDARTVRITLKAPNGNFPWNMAWGDAVIFGPESQATNATNPVGTGPYRFSQWVQGDRVELVANTGYWGEAPRLSKVTFRFIADPTAAFAALMAGDVDAFPVFPAPETLSQLAADPRFSVIVGSTEGETILAMNNKAAPLDNIKVRQAIAHAIDRQAIIDGAMFGYGTPIGTHFAPHNPDYVDLTGLSAHDPAKSRALLAEAGVSGLKLRLFLPPPAYARRGGEIIAAQLRDVGIEAEIIPVEWAQWLEQVFKAKDFDLTIVSHVEPADINIYARPDYYFQYGKPEFAALIEKLGLATDEAERSALNKAAQQMIAEDYVNGYLFQLAKTGVANARIVGLWENSPVNAIDITGVYWTD
jgi:peptide/nickel transport system substrate-binding protein